MNKLGLLLFFLIAFTLLSTAQSSGLLADKKGIVYARNLLDWQKKPVASLSFDIYYPPAADPTKNYPVFFLLHGGSFTKGSSKAVTPMADQMAGAGFVVIAPNYRKGYKNSFITCVDSTGLEGAIYRAMQDVNACMRYVANHATDYHVDTSWMFVGGASAGGTLSLNLSYVTDSLAAIHYPSLVQEWGKLQTSGNSEPYNYTLKGICAMWGGMPAWDNLINSQSAIPTILYKGGRDNNLPDGVGHYHNCPQNSVVRAGQGIYNEMVAAGRPCVYHNQVNATHIAYDNDFCTATATCFFKALMTGRPYSGYYEYYESSCL